MKLVFVCLGNICRSPLAEGIAREYVREMGYDFEVDSAGISGSHRGEAPHRLSQHVAKEMGIDISGFKSSQVSPYMDGDYFIAMDMSNFNDLLRLGIPKQKVLKIGDYGLDGRDVPDPYYGGVDGFYQVRDMLKIAIKNLCDELARES